MPEVQTPTRRATSANVTLYFSTNLIAIRSRTADTPFRRLPEVNSALTPSLHYTIFLSLTILRLSFLLAIT